MTNPTSPPVAIITGAGSGIGSAVARQLLALGWRVVLAGRSEIKLRMTAEELLSKTPVMHGAIRCVPTDVADPNSVAALIHETDAAFGRIDALINNAGEAFLAPIDKTGPGELQRSFAVNALGPAYAIHAAWPVFTRQKSGRIVNTSTKGTIDPFPGFFAYAAAKSAVNSMARSCATEGARAGIKAFAVAPGAVETGMLRSMWSPQQIKPEMCLSPDDVARVIVECASGARDADNGRTIFLARESDGVKQTVKE